MGQDTPVRALLQCSQRRWRVSARKRKAGMYTFLSLVALITLVNAHSGHEDIPDTQPEACTIDLNTDYAPNSGLDIRTAFQVASKDLCARECFQQQGCRFWTFVKATRQAFFGNCFLKADKNPQVSKTAQDGSQRVYISGNRICGDPTLQVRPKRNVACFQTGTAITASPLETKHIAVVEKGYQTPFWCQVRCMQDPQCRFFVYEFKQGSYTSEGAHDTNEVDCRLYQSDQPTVARTEKNRQFVKGPKFCPGEDRAAWKTPHTQWPLRINAGGPPHKDVYDKEWLQDRYFDLDSGPANVYSEPFFYLSLPMEPLAHTGREEYKYSIPVESPIAVVVTLYLAEVEYKGGYGNRKQNAYVEGNMIFFDFDVLTTVQELLAPDGPKQITKDVTKNGQVTGQAVMTIYNGPNEPFGSILKVETPLVVVEDNELNIWSESLWNKAWLTAFEVQATEVILDLKVVAQGALQTDPYVVLEMNPSQREQMITIRNDDAREAKLTPSLNGGDADEFTFEPAELVIPSQQSRQLKVVWTSSSPFSVAMLQLTRHLKVLLSGDSAQDKPDRIEVQSNVQMGLITPLAFGGSGKDILVPLTLRGNSGPSASVKAIVAFGSEEAIAVSVPGVFTIKKPSFVDVAPPLEIGANSPRSMRVSFAAQQAGSYELIIALIGDFVTRFMTVSGRAVNQGEPHYLHPVLDLPEGGYVVDYDGDEVEVVGLIGHFSHTHEPKQAIASWTFDVNGQVVASGEKEDYSASFPIGLYTVQLTIADLAQKTLADTGSVSVVPISRIPGCIFFLFRPPTASVEEFFGKGVLNERELTLVAGSQPPEPARWIKASLSTGCGITPDARTKQLLGSSFKDGVVLQAVGELKVNSAMRNEGGLVPLEVASDDAVEVRLAVDGRPEDLIKKKTALKLEDGPHSFVLVLYIRVPTSNPIQLLAHGAVVTLDEVVHSEEQLPPFINRVTPTKAHTSGGEVIKLEGAGFYNVQAATKRNAVLMFGEGNPLDLLTDGRIRHFDGRMIEFEIPKHAEGRLSLSVTTPLGNSNAIAFEYSSRVPPALKWTPEKTLMNFQSEKPLKDSFLQDWIGSLTQGEWGPDRRLYLSDIGGGVRSILFKDNDEVDEASLIEITTIKEKYPGHAITGFAFDPFSDPDNPEMYVAHAPMFHWQQGDCFSPQSDYAEFIGVLSKLTGWPNFRTLETVVDGLPMSNHDHGLNGISFDNKGNLFFPIGANTNMGWPVCILGGLPENHFTAAVVKVELRNPRRSKTLEWVDYFTRELVERPNQVVADRYDIAPWVTGIYPYSYGFRNAYDSVFTTKGELFVSQNGWNEGYGLAVDGPPSEVEGQEACEFDMWDKTSYATAERGLNPFWKGGKVCKPKIIDDWTDPDRLFRTTYNSYHGLPNPARARNMKDDRQWRVRDANAPHQPPVFSQGYSWESSTNGVTEFRGNCFAGAMRGDLIGSKWNGWLWHVDVPYHAHEEGRDVKISKLKEGGVAGLEVTYGPGCSLFVLDYTKNRLKHIQADDEDAKANPAPTAFDITPWRGSPRFNNRVIIGGYNFNGRGKQKSPSERKLESIIISGIRLEIHSQTDTRVEATVPPATGIKMEELLDVEFLFSDGSKTTLPQSWLWADPGPPIDPTPARPNSEAVDGGCFSANVDFAAYDASSDLGKIEGVKSALSCHRECAKSSECRFFTYDSIGKLCYLKLKDEPKKEGVENIISGPKFCTDAGSVCFDEHSSLLPGKGATMRLVEVLYLPDGQFLGQSACVSLCESPACSHFVYTEALCEVGSDGREIPRSVFPAASQQECDTMCNGLSYCRGVGATYRQARCSLYSITGPGALVKPQVGWYRQVSGPAQCPGTDYSAVRLAAVSGGKNGCPVGFHSADGKACYQVRFERKNYFDAVDACGALGEGVSLAMPKNYGLTAALSALFCDGLNEIDCFVPRGGSLDGQFFLGMTATQAGTWRWQDGHTVLWDGFEDTSPVPGMCGAFEPIGATGLPLRRWSSVPCNEERFFVCEKLLDPSVAELGEIEKKAAASKLDVKESATEKTTSKPRTEAPLATAPPIERSDEDEDEELATTQAVANSDFTNPSPDKIPALNDRTRPPATSLPPTKRPETTTRRDEPLPREDTEVPLDMTRDPPGRPDGSYYAIRIIDQSFEDIDTEEDTRNAFLRNVRDALADDLNVQEQYLRIHALEKGSVVVLFDVELPGDRVRLANAVKDRLHRATSSDASAIRRRFTIDPNFPVLKVPMPSTVPLVDSRVAPSVKGGGSSLPKRRSPSKGTSDGDSFADDTPAMLTAIIGGGLLLIALIAFFVLWRLHVSKKADRDRDGRLKKRNSATDVEIEDRRTGTPDSSNPAPTGFRDSNGAPSRRRDARSPSTSDPALQARRTLTPSERENPA